MVAQLEPVSGGGDISMQVPCADLGHALFELVKHCPPLDTNSAYCNLLQCTHFSGTSVAALQNGDLVGFVSGYLIPERQQKTLFVWQIAVASSARGQGLASKMLGHLLKRPQCEGVAFIETTITEGNRASWALFERLAHVRRAELQRSVMFDKQQHFKGAHATEMLVRIGPF